MKSSFYKSLFCFFLVTNLSGQYGDVPANNIPPNGWPAISWSDPGGWATINVNDHGLPANDSSIDASLIIANIINTGSGRRILRFPAGEYYFKTNLIIQDSNIRFKGDGMQLTRLNLDGLGSQPLKIAFMGSAVGNEIDISSNSNRGSNTITVANASSIVANDFIILKRDNDLNQIVRVKAKNGNTLTLGMKLGNGYSPSNNGRILKYSMVKNIAIEDLTLKRLRRNGTSNSFNIQFAMVNNGLIRNVGSEFGGNSHFNISNCLKIEINAIKAHSAYDYGGGGNGYGVNINGNSTRVLVTNSKLWNLRHHIILSRSANHCVIAYNHTSQRQNNEDDLIMHGFSSHNNLFEGNNCYNIGNDQRSDLNANQYQARYNTLFRNKVRNRVLMQPGDDPGNLPHEHYLIVGNVYKSSEPLAQNSYRAANRVNGTVQWGNLSTSSNIPNSFYYNSKPSFLGNTSWPVYGPGQPSFGNSNTIPAEEASKDIFSGSLAGGPSVGTWYRLENVYYDQWLQASDGTNLNVVSKTNTGTKTRWKLVNSNESGWYRIENENYGNWLQASNGINVKTVSTSSTGNKTKWRLINQGNGTYKIENQQFVETLKSENGGRDVRTVPITSTGQKVIWKFVPVQVNFKSSISHNDSFESEIVFIYPNPTKDFITLSIPAKREELLSVNISDSSGRLLITTQEYLFEGENELTLDISTLPAGIYHIVGKSQLIHFSKPLAIN